MWPQNIQKKNLERTDQLYIYIYICKGFVDQHRCDNKPPVVLLLVLVYHQHPTKRPGGTLHGHGPASRHGRPALVVAAAAAICAARSSWLSKRIIRPCPGNIHLSQGVARGWLALVPTKIEQHIDLRGGTEGKPHSSSNSLFRKAACAPEQRRRDHVCLAYCSSKVIFQLLTNWRDQTVQHTGNTKTIWQRMIGNGMTHTYLNLTSGLARSSKLSDCIARSYPYLRTRVFEKAPKRQPTE